MSVVAAIQMTSTSDLKSNLSVVERLLQKAYEVGAKLVVLPEMFPFQSPESLEKITLAEELGSGKIQSFLSEQAKKHQLWIVGGTIPIRTQSPDKVYAASLVFNSQGQLVTHYNKIHLFDVTVDEKEHYLESATVEPGNTLCLVDTPVGKLGLAVCYDIRFPEMFRCLFNQGAELFAIPAAFTAPTAHAHIAVYLPAPAIDNLAYIITACQTGEHEHFRRTYGHSMIVSPWGSILQQLPEGEGIVVSHIDLALLKKIRKDIPIKDHQKLVLKEWKVTVM